MISEKTVYDDSYLRHASADAVRASAVAELLWQRGPLSRSQIRQLSGAHPNLIGSAVEKLRRAGVAREMEAAGPSTGLGRPQVGLEIDPDQRRVVGLSIMPGIVQAVPLNLLGQEKQPVGRRHYETPAQMMRGARALIDAMVDDRAIAVGVSVTGFVDVEHAALLLSSATPDTHGFSLRGMLDEIRRRSGEAPVILGNDLHALAAQWSLEHRRGATEDTLLIGLNDGRLGAAMLIEGVPNRGCVLAANELGHTRLPVRTARCYCGGVGCLERIASTEQLRRLGASRSFVEVAHDPGEDEPMLREVIESLSLGVANAVQLVRPSRLVFASELAQAGPFIRLFEEALKRQLLDVLRDRIIIEWWSVAHIQTAQTAGWLALATLFSNVWSHRHRRETSTDR